MIKGIVLGGGLGTRLAPLTQNDNKHLLPIYKKRMIEYPIDTLVRAGIKDIVLVTGGNRPGAFLELLKNGAGKGVSRLYYTYQEGNAGIADALKLAKPFIGSGERCVVILGDNYFEDGIISQLTDWFDSKKACAGILVKEVDKPWDFGIAEFNEKGQVISIEEKPNNPKSSSAILGCYFFDYSLWKKIEDIKPSTRGEFEITDILKIYMKERNFRYYKYSGFWSDMGTFDNWMNVSKRVAGKVDE